MGDAGFPLSFVIARRPQADAAIHAEAPLAASGRRHIETGP